MSPRIFGIVRIPSKSLAFALLVEWHLGCKVPISSVGWFGGGGWFGSLTTSPSLV